MLPPIPDGFDYNRCFNCKYFESLKHNSNFGICKFGTDPRLELESLLSPMFGGQSTQFPIVHNDDVYKCFENK